MTNPTSNFGWQMPTNTDLVTDLPADFEVFGQAVDTAMADLKGGTTGQILAKATNTDMDFTWITNDQGDITGITASSPLTGGGTSGAVTIGILSGTTSNLGAVQLSDSISSTSTTLAATANAVKTTYDLAAAAVPKSTVTAKGSIFTATASATPAQIAVGNNGETLLADSTTATGLRYQSAFNGNAIIGGGFDNWQRGTSFTAGGVYSADRWYLPAVSGTTTVSRDTDVPTGLAGQYSIKQLTAAASSFAQWATPLESATVIPLQGQTMVLSWYMKANATWSNNFSAVIFYSNSTDARASQTTSVTFSAVTTPTPTTSWARYYGTFTMPSDAQGLLVQFNPSIAQASGASLNMAGVQLEIGNVPTRFKRAGGTIQGELAACQRYLPAIIANNNNIFGFATNTTTSYINCQFPVTARVAPTGITIPALSNFLLFNYLASSAAPTAITFDNAGTSAGFIAVTTTAASPTLVGGNPDWLRVSNANGYILFTGCEL